MQGTKRKLEETSTESGTERNVKRRVTPMLVSIFEVKHVFGGIMDNLIRPGSEHQTTYEECTTSHCYCHFAFTFSALAISCKEMHIVCEEYRRHVTENLESTGENKEVHANLWVPPSAFRMHIGNLCVYAAAHGYLEIMKYARTALNAPWFKTKDGKASPIQWFDQDPFVAVRTCPCSNTRYISGETHRKGWIVTSVSSKNGHSDCLEYAVSNGCELEESGMIHAAQNGDTECIRVYLENRKTTNGRALRLEYALEESILSLNDDCIDLLLQHTSRATRCVFHKCAQVGDIETAIKISKKFNASPWDDRAWICAVSRDYHHNLQYLRWLSSSDCPKPDVKTTGRAARNGSLGCLEYLVSIGVPVDESTTEQAAEGGSLACLKYLREIGCPWNCNTAVKACSSGNIHCLKYACENGCPIDKNAKFYAKNLECLKYVHEHGAVWKKNFIRNTMDWSTEEEALQQIRYAVETGCPMNEDSCTAAAYHGYLEILKYLHSKGCPWGPVVFERALDSYRDEDTAKRVPVLKCIQYLILNGCPLPVD